MTNFERNGKSKIEENFVLVVMEYLNAVKSRDGAKVSTFLYKEPHITHVLPGARVLTDIKSYLNSQQPWHEGKTGKYDYKIHFVEAIEDMGFASVFAFYNDVDNHTAKPFSLELYISFLFRKLEGKWLLVHSQNTVLKEVR